MSAPSSDPTGLRYEPALDGLRGLSVALVLLYHAGFSWMSGGFFGVEVFFVVSGFLITSLLLAEHEGTGRVSLGNFWRRRGRRLFPALGAVLLAVMAWTALWGSAEQISQVSRDVPWAVFYVSNWGQILGDIPYFTSDPPLLRHLWSLGVEEQWYLIWPLAVMGLAALSLPRRAKSVGVAASAAAAMAFTFWLESRSPTVLGGPPALFEGVDRTNFMYLSTLTRTSGLLLGSAAAFAWRPDQKSRGSRPLPRWFADTLGVAAIGAVLAASVFAVITEGYVYRWLLPLVSVSSLAAVVVATRGGSSHVRRALSWPPFVAVGLRSYGLYLWSWPIFVVVDATDGSVGRFIVAMALSIVVTELSYRFLEQPVRRGALGRLWSKNRQLLLAGTGVLVVLVGGLTVFFASAEDYEPLAGDQVEEFDGDLALAGPPEVSPDTSDPDADGEGAATADPAVTSSTVLPSIAAADPTTTESVMPGAAGDVVSPQADLVILGDSQAGSMVRNLPHGVDELFPAVIDGSLEGCSVWDSGAIRSEVDMWTDLPKCAGWQEDWARSAEGTDVAVVMLGAWDVFDIVDGDAVLVFGSPEFDAEFTSRLRSGIDVVLDVGTNVALLEIPCMRPIDVPIFGVVALPERGDDARVAHLNELLREVAAGYGPAVEVVEGPPWCDDARLSIDSDFRWDGVHLHPPGVRLLLETVAADLLRLASA